MEERSYHPVSDVDDSAFMPFSTTSPEVTRYTRSTPPADYALKLKCFSSLCHTLLENKEEKYKSGCFEVGGYQWKLILYPDGDKKRHGDGFISLYLAIGDADNLSVGLEVNVHFKSFVYDQIRDNYLIIQDAPSRAIKRFHRMNTEHGFAQFLALSTFKDPSNGYLIDDTCIFGVELFVIRNTAKGEVFTITDRRNESFSWTITEFSKLKNKDYESCPVFQLGRRKWRFGMYPKGDEWHKEKYFSLYLYLVEETSTPTKHGRWLRRDQNPPAERIKQSRPDQEPKVYVECQLRVWDHLNGKHKLRTIRQWFSTTSNCARYGNFLALSTLYDESSGLIFEDTLIFEVCLGVTFEVDSLF